MNKINVRVIALVVIFVLLAGCAIYNPWTKFEATPEVIVTEPVETVAMKTTVPVETFESIPSTEFIEETEPVVNSNKNPEESEESKTEISDEQYEQDEQQEQEEGKADKDEDEDESELRSLGTFKLTAYCACSKCCGKSNGITASGTKAKAGRTIAVDPKQIPYGTKVVINGHTYVAEDCGGGIGKNCIDVFFDSHKEALNFGVQRAEVFVYG